MREIQKGEVKGEGPQGQDQDLPRIIVAGGDHGREVDLGHRGALLEAREDDIYYMSATNETSRATSYNYTRK